MKVLMRAKVEGEGNPLYKNHKMKYNVMRWSASVGGVVSDGKLECEYPPLYNLESSGSHNEFLAWLF
jgi:hypothetical protein